ncbi:2-dehydropantoate 2-reductase [Virgibacillus oceani]
MNIGIIGGGSTGLLLSTYLSRQHSVTIYVRKEDQRIKLMKDGVRLSNYPGRAYIRALLSEDLQDEDCVIICVKQVSISAIIPLLRKIRKNTPLIFLQNGMGHLDDIKELYHPIILGVIEHGAMKLEDNLVAHTGKGKINLAAYQGDEAYLHSLSKKLNHSDFPFDFKENYLRLLKEKLVINAVINPLTALFQVTNGEVMRNRYLHNMAQIICEEACAVLEMDYATRWARVEYICENTAKNRSSMFKDIMDSRKTEIEAISGYIIKKGNGFTIPYTRFLYDSMKAIEIKKGITD